MTFSIIVPNASQSPGLFPAQNNTNFQRIKDIINNDHFFVDTSSSIQGYHKKVSFINQAALLVGLSGASSILYALADGSGASQLMFYNGASTEQLTPKATQFPIRVVGSSAAVVSGGTVTAFADPGYLWAGTGWAILQATNRYTYSNIIRSGSNGVFVSDSIAGTPTVPSFSFSGNNLLIKNNASGVQNLVWSLILNRIS